jgi:NADPH-dependent 7-cyano-7-deazaguanine reductase QueF
MWSLLYLHQLLYLFVDIGAFDSDDYLASLFITEMKVAYITLFTPLFDIVVPLTGTPDHYTGYIHF